MASQSITHHLILCATNIVLDPPQEAFFNVSYRFEKYVEKGAFYVDVDLPANLPSQNTLDIVVQTEYKQGLSKSEEFQNAFNKTIILKCEYLFFSQILELMKYTKFECHF